MYHLLLESHECFLVPSSIFFLLMCPKSMVCFGGCLPRLSSTQTWMVFEVDADRYTIKLWYHEWLWARCIIALVFADFCTMQWFLLGPSNFTDVSWVVQAQRIESWCQHRAATCKAERRTAQREGVLKEALTRGKNGCMDLPTEKNEQVKGQRSA